MKQIFTLALLVLGTASLAAADEYRELSGSHQLGANQTVHVDFHSGDLEIEAASTDRVEIEVGIECKWNRRDCEDLLDEIEIKWRSTERRLHLEVEGISAWRLARIEIEATIKLPARADLFVEMAAGRLGIDGMTNDVRVDMGAGELRVWMQESAVEGVTIDVGVGDAKFRGKSEYISGRRSMLIGSEVYWDDGPGRARVDIELGAGDATVWLD